MRVLLHTNPHFSAAKKWIAQVLLVEMLGLQVEIVFRDTVKGYLLELPNGGQIRLEDHFFCRCDPQNFPASARMPDTPLRVNAPFPPREELVTYYGRPFLEATAGTIHCGLDIWASAFFMLSRWEEVGKTRNGRFQAEDAFAVRQGLLHRPLVHEYAAFLRECMHALGMSVAYPQQAARLHLSCDVDHPQCWKRPADRLKTLAGSVLRRHNPAELAYWLGGPIWQKADPFDVFDAWMELAASRNLGWHFNFLAGRAAAPDCDYDLDDPFLRNLLHRIQERGHAIGFHPSRAASTDPRRFQLELEALRAAAPCPVRSGRQHYLHFSPPETWRLWAAAGMDWESSLGYAEQEGFRCGIAQSFPVFDCERQTPLPVRELPLIAMDVTLAQYRRLRPDQATASLEQLGAAVRKHGGEMVLLWHNSSWDTYFWRPWRDVLLHTIQKW